MVQKKHEGFWWANRAGVVAVALALGILIFGGYGAPSASAVPSKDKNQEMTWVYSHTYDEVFQACQEVIERMGLFVAAKDKDKGTISGNGKYQMTGEGFTPITFDVRIEALNTKPETRVTISNLKVKKEFLDRPVVERGFKGQFPVELQKVLSTYH